MTPAEVRLVLYEVLGTGVFLNTSAFVIFVCSSFVAVALTASAISFFGKRGETAAIRRDLSTIKDTLAQTTAVTEEIKAGVSGALWLQQKRWDAKWESYSELVVNFGELYALMAELIARMRRGPGHEESPEAFQRMTDRKNQEAEAAFQKTRRFGSKARLAVAPEVRTLLTEVGNRWNESAHDAEKQATIAREAWLEIADIARNDLFGEPRDEPRLGTASKK